MLLARQRRFGAASERNNLTWHKHSPPSTQFAQLEPSNLAQLHYYRNELLHWPTLLQNDNNETLKLGSQSSGPSADLSSQVGVAEKASDESNHNGKLVDHAGRDKLLNLNSSIGCNHSNTARGFQQQRQQLQNLLILLLAATSLTCLHNAQPSSGLSFAQHDNNLGLVGADYPLQLYQPNLVDQLQQQQQQQQQQIDSHLTSAGSQWARLRRSPDDETPATAAIMSSGPGSLSQDPTSSIGPPGEAQASWTSILNPFGLGQRPPATQGGGGDEFDTHIKKILVPRVSGTPGNVQVREYIVNEMRKHDYHVELDEFTGNTPVGKVKFANIIASSNPRACRQLVLACHHDSKLMDGFLGAIDSAVPCAMLLMLAKTFKKSFRPAAADSAEEAEGQQQLGLQFIFFDGEEAFVQWTHTDSLYGSRHLAAKWEKQRAPNHCGGPAKSQLDRIELFLLLDLIGASDTSFVSYNAQLKHHYERLQQYEKSHLQGSGGGGGGGGGGLSQFQVRRASAFKSRTMPLDFVEDDHVPFRKRGVPILLLLAHPFPSVWHTVADNYQAIDFPRTRRILHVLEQFVANYPDGSGGGGGGGV